MPNTSRTKRVMIMNQTVPQQPGPKERAKAGFGIVDEMLKAYNGGETYVKRFLTFVGIGGVITGTALGYRPHVSPQAPRAEPIIIQMTPPTSLPATSPAKPESSPAKPAEPSTTQPVAEIQPEPSQKTPPSQPKVRPAPLPKPVIATQPVPSHVTVQKPSIVITPPILKRPAPSLPFEVDQSDQDDRFEIDD